MMNKEKNNLKGWSKKGFGVTQGQKNKQSPTHLIPENI